MAQPNYLYNTFKQLFGIMIGLSVILLFLSWQYLKNGILTIPVRQEKSLNFFFIVTFLSVQKSNNKNGQK